MFVVELLKRRYVSKNRIGLFSEKTNIILFILTVTELCVSSSQDRFGPRFVHEPPSLVEFDNNTDTMVHCSARGSPIPRITWTHKDGSDIGDVPGLRHVRSDGSLFFPSFRSDNYRPDIHDATYICVASNIVGTLGSRDVRIKGVVQRHFKIQVHDEFVIKGNVAVLQCHVPSFVREYVSVAYWKREDGVVIHSTVSKGGRYSVLPNGELHIRNVTSKDGLAGYRCHVRHRLTSDITVSTDVGRLVVKDPHIVSPPRVRTQQQRIQAVRGKDVELTCVAQAFPIPTYRWYRDHYLISSSYRLTIVDSSLLIEQVEITDSGKYVCIANNSLGEKSVQITLVVTAPLLAEIQPETQEVRIGKPAILNCTVSGHPIHSIYWKKNNQHLVEDGRIRLLSRKVLYMNKVKREDQGMYQCFVYNSQESTQGSVELKLQEVAPSMVVTFPERNLKPGMSLSLRCSASGNPLPVITWKLDGFQIPETSRLRIGDFVTSHGHVVSYVNISDVRVEDGGEYSCKATNAVESVTHAGKINVYGPPIIRQMENVTVLSGETVTLRCAVSGYPIKSITWERDGSPLPLTHRQKVESHGTLIVRKMERPADDGEYICIAKSPEGLTARGRIYVIIKVAPLIDEEFFPETKIVSQGMRVKLVCAIIKGDTPIRIRWMKDGGAVVRENKRRVQTLDDSSLLVLTNVSYSDSGNYTCLASNNAATVNRTTTLVVNVPPQWTMEPTNSNVVHGSRISVDCLAEGFPKPRTFWKKSSGEKPVDFREIGPSYKMQVHRNGSLVIQEADISDSGYYMCQANNGIGEGLSKVIFLKVHAPPKFETKFESQAVRKEEDAILSCEARGEPPLKVHWKKDQHNLDIGSDKKYSVKEEDMHEGRISSQLILSSTDRQDSALYTCIVTNQYGSDERKIQLVVQEPPSPPTYLTVAAVTSRTVELSWKPSYSGNSAILKYIVQYKNASGSWDRKFTSLVFSSSETSATIKGLLPVSTYHFRVLAESLLGQSQPSAIVECITAEEVPGGPPLNVHVEVTGSQSLKVTWTPPKPELQHGIIQGYYLGYKQTDSDHPFQYKRIEKSTGPHHITYLTNLRRNTNYTVLVQAFNEVGAGPRSDETYAVTLKAAPPTSPVISVMSTSSSTITIQWKPDRNDDTLKEYTLHYKHDGSDWKKESINVKSNRYTLKDLKCGTWYRLFMTSSNSLGSGEPRDPITIRTKGGAPVSPRKEDFIQPNTTFLTLNLEAWHNGGCPIQNFNVQYRTTFQRRWNTASLPLIVPQNQSIIRHLAPGREYNLLVNARNEAGTTEAEYTVKTLNLSLTSPAITAPPPVLEDSYLPFYRNFTVLLPVTVSIVVLLVVIVTVIVCLRRQSDISSRASSGDSQSRKGRQADTVGMVDFYQKGGKEGDISLKSSTYFSPASGKNIGITFNNRHCHHDDNHEYAEPYAAVPPTKCVTRDGCPTILSAATRTEGPYATMKRNPPRPLTYLPSINEGVKVRNSRQMAQLERPITCNNAGTSSSGSSGDRPSSM